jgi:Secretion system C-terminal sorting domain
MNKIIIFTLITASISFAQITITSADILGLLGNSGTTKEDTTGFVQVNVGSPGENQSWDLSAINVQGSISDYLFIDPAETPYAGQFPQSNFSQRIIFSEDPTATYYSFFEVTPAYIRSLGFAASGGDSNFVDFGDTDETGLPLSYGTSWTSVSSDTFEIEGGYFLNIDSTYSTIDGWGTVTVPAGTFDCLRLRDNNVYISSTVFGEFVFNDTSTTISYEWLTKNNFVVANIESMEDETDINFNLAEYVSLLQDSENSTAIASAVNIQPQQYILQQNYPNPFNPETQISYELAKSSYVTLKIFNSSGEEIRTLVSQWQSAGKYSVPFDAADLSSAVYFYRLQTDGFSQVKRMILLK